MLESDLIILTQIKAIKNPAFVKLLSLANECSDYRGRPLKFSVGKPNVQVNSENRITNVSLLPDPINRSFEHDAAHELCHVIANCCGFSYKISIFEESLLPKPNSALDLAVGQLCKTLGNVFTHAAVHKILQASGYEGQDWDNYLITEVEEETQKARKYPPLEDELLRSRAWNVGWAIQYEKLSDLKLPGLDLAVFEEKLRQYFRLLRSNFDNDLSTVRDALEIGNILDVEGCLESTKSLAAAFGKLLQYPVEKLLTIEITCKPSEEWSLDAITKRLREARG